MSEIVNNLLKNSTFGWWDVVIAAVVAVLGWLASGWGRRGVRKLLERWSALSAELTNLLSRLVRYAILLLTIGIVLSVLGAPLQPVLAAVIILATVTVLALRGIAANFGAGIVIQARRPVRMGDTIEVDGFSGRIIELSGRTVLLLTSEGRTVRLPNTTLLQRPLVNASESGSVRSEIWVRVESAASPDEVSALLSDTARQLPHRAERTPHVLVSASGPGHVDASVRVWSSYDEREELRSDAVRAVRRAFEDHGHTVWVSSRRPPDVYWVRRES